MFKKVVPRVEEELNDGLPLRSWQTLTGYHDGLIALHTINVVFRVICHPVFANQFSKDEQNIVKWAALLHDIAKRNEPDFQGKDHIHPFIGGSQVLKMLRHLNIIQTNGIKQEKEFIRLIRLIEDSKDPV